MGRSTGHSRMKPDALLQARLEDTATVYAV